MAARTQVPASNNNPENAVNLYSLLALMQETAEK